MQLRHSCATAVVEPELAKVATGTLMTMYQDRVGGAVDQTGDLADIVEAYWEVFSIYETEKLLKQHEHVVLGDYLDEIEERIKDCYRDTTPDGCTRVQRVNGRKLQTGRSERVIRGWLVYDRPFSDAEDIDLLQSLSLRVGPILVPESTYDEYGEDEGLSRYSFTSTRRKCGMWQINYNPAAIKRRPYLVEKKEALRRLEGEFPGEVIWSLMSQLNANRWPNNHPFCGAVIGASLSDRAGWGHSHNKSFGPGDVLEQIALTLKLWPRERWWRTATSGYRYGSTSFETVLTQALEYVHGVELAAARKRERYITQAKEEYADRIREEVDLGPNGLPLGWDGDGDEDGTERELSEAEFVASYVKVPFSSGMLDSLKLCRWLRAEARAMGVQMPKKPVLPLTPAQLRAKRKRKKTRRKTARKSRKQGAK